MDDVTGGALALRSRSWQSARQPGMRTGDVAGDGVVDVVVGADRESSVAPQAGALYVIVDGPHLG